MFRRTPKSFSPSVGCPEPLPHARLDDPARLREDQLQEWREAARGVARTYKAWCAANWLDRRDRYLSFLDALGREERAARQVEPDASALGAADSGS